MKNIEDYTSQELFNELKRREKIDKINLIQKKIVVSKKIDPVYLSINDVVVEYFKNQDIETDEIYYLYQFGFEINGQIELFDYGDHGVHEEYDLHEFIPDFMGSFCEDTYKSKYSLEKTLEKLKEIGFTKFIEFEEDE